MDARSAARRLPALPALDGIRAVAVIAVLLYHADLWWFRGGFLGVEVFFVLSGYLITSLLWRERRAMGGIGLRRFWTRRARRLLPAVFLLLGVVTAAFVIGWPSEIGRIRGDLVAALGYVSNWYLIGTDHSYFAALGRPSPFGHLWSLAIEEQFYLVWPVVLLVASRFVRRPQRLALGIVGAALVSAAAMWVTYNAADPSRAYFGTDTRAAGLLLGAALAIVWRPYERLHRFEPSPRALDATIVLASAWLVWTFLRFDEFASFTYRPGIHLVSLGTVALIAAVVHPRARLSRILAWRPLRWIGRRSYSIYLWHWPVFVVTRPGVDLDISIGTALALRVAITLVLAEASFRYVEEPIRHGALGRLRRRVAARARRSPTSLRRVALGWGTVGLVALLSFGMLATAVAKAPAPAPVASDDLLNPGGPPDLESSPLPVKTSPTPKAGSGKQASARRHRSIPDVPKVRKVRVTAVGDSVLLGARSALRDRISRVFVDGEVSRSVGDGIDELRRLKKDGRLGAIVVVHLGHNGMFTADQFDQVMWILRDVRQVIMVTVKVPRRWESPVNATIRKGVVRYPEATLVDWNLRWRDCPGRVFAPDGFHLTAAGAACYSALISAAIAG